MKSSADLASAIRRPPFGVKTVKLMSLGPQRVGELLDQRGGGHFEQFRVGRGRFVERRAARGGALAPLFDRVSKTFSELGDFNRGRLARHEC